MKNVVFTNNGTIHRPTFVQLQWGKDLIFKGISNFFNISYTQFDAEGRAQKAIISIGLEQYKASQALKIQDQDNPPDTADAVSALAGETLPAMCERIWNSQKYYVQAAHYNQLNKFRNLKGTDKLIFPSINPNN